MKKKLVFLLILSLLLSLAACGASPAPAAPETETIVFTDDCSRDVILPKDISRIVATGPLSQIVLYTIAPDMLVGLTNKWDGSAAGIVPERYLQLPYFGQLYNTANLNVEELAMADPQVIIDIGRVMSGGAGDMDTLQRQTHIPTVFLNFSVETMADTYRTLGKLLNRQEKAEQLAQFCEKVYSRTLSILEQVGDHKVTALYIKGEDGLSVLAKGSYHAELIDLLTENVAAVGNPSSKGSGNEVTMEQIALWNPQFLLFDAASIYDTVSGMGIWSELTAISTGNYLKVPEGPHNWMSTPPAVQRCLGMIWLTAQLYPEYCDYDVKAEILEFYDLFYGCKLTEDQYTCLTEGAFLGE